MTALSALIMGPKKTIRCDRHDVLLRNDLHHVENEPVVFKYGKVDVLAPDHLSRTLYGGISENR
jgi:hypothetical protein